MALCKQAPASGMPAKFFLVLALLMAAPSLAPSLAGNPARAAECCKARLWPSAERARFIFESGRPLEYRILGLQNPPRIALDLFTPDGDDALPGAVRVSLERAPYLADFRAARHDEKTLRFVFALAGGARHEVWRVAPVGEYGHRLALDIHPVGGPDPLLALILELEEKERAPDEDAFVVMIDPGHGGEDPGAVSPSGKLEKDLVLKISRRIRDEINSRPGMRALMTRDGDHFIPLARRVEIAHRLGADAFLSVHADSVASPAPHGSSVFVLSTRGASSPLARRLARHANLSDLIGGESAAAADPADEHLLRQISRDGKERASRSLGTLLLRGVAKINALHGGDMIHSAGFAVLKSPSIPSALLETAFISNPEDEAKLQSEEFQKKMAVSVADALQEYGDQFHVADSDSR